MSPVFAPGAELDERSSCDSNTRLPGAVHVSVDEVGTRILGRTAHLQSAADVYEVENSNARAGLLIGKATYPQPTTY